MIRRIGKKKWHFSYVFGAIYSIYYSHWKKNIKIYAFILHGNPITPKVHALNLGAKELTSVDRAKLVHTIVQLSKANNATLISGKTLYRIFLTYLRPQVRKCYRTYFSHFILRASVINYGLNKPEDFSESDMKVYNPNLYLAAKRDFFIKILNTYTRRGVDVANVKNALAKVEAKMPQQVEQKERPVEQPETVVSPEPIEPEIPETPEGGGEGPPGY